VDETTPEPQTATPVIEVDAPPPGKTMTLERHRIIGTQRGEEGTGVLILDSGALLLTGIPYPDLRETLGYDGGAERDVEARAIGLLRRFNDILRIATPLGSVMHLLTQKETADSFDAYRELSRILRQHDEAGTEALDVLRQLRQAFPESVAGDPLTLRASQVLEDIRESGSWAPDVPDTPDVSLTSPS